MYSVKSYNNFKYLIRNSNLNKIFYTTSTQPINQNKKSLNIDFNKAFQQINDHNNINKDESQSTSQSLPESISKIQEQLLNCNENDLNDLDRLMAARTLNRIQYNIHPSKLNKDILDKIWKLINMDKKSTDSYITVLGDQLGIAIKTWYLYPQVYNSVKEVVNEIRKLEEEGKFNSNDELISETLKNAYHVAYVLGMWKEMMIIRSKMNQDSIKDTQLFYKSKNQFGADQAYKIITNNISNSIFTTPIIDIEKDSTTSPTNINEIYPYKNYSVTSTLFKNQKLTNINIDENEFKRLEDEFNKLVNTNKKDINGYSSLYFKDESFLTIIGSAVKYSDGFKVYSGIYNKDSNRIQLYSNFEFAEIKISIEEQMDLKVEFINGPNDNSSLKLYGKYRCSTNNDGKSYIMDMDIIYSFKIDNN